MQTLQDLVSSTVNSLVQNNTLFTALDVSNKVKETMPLARHRDVRDEVRSLFTSDMEPNGYARTPINVTLPDGTTAEALLYHPLSASWDLDVEYDAQKRAQAASRPTTPVVVAPPTVSVATVAADGSITVNAPTATVQGQALSNPTVAQAAARDLWKSMFNSQPSLFPRK